MKVSGTKNLSEKKTTHILEKINKLIARQHDYINPRADGNISWRSDNACSSDSEEALEN
jgi:hypothetical protein